VDGRANSSGLGAAGVVEVVPDIESAKWMELVLNATELAPSAVVDLPLAEAFALSGMPELMPAAGREAIRTGVVCGHTVVPILGLTMDQHTDADSYVDVLIATVMSHFTFASTLTTILQDWRKGRRGETDEINGLVAREAARLGGEAPVNGRIAELAQGIEHGLLTAGAHNLPRLINSL
jgi:2-dehydropantoate 2-reductase